MPCRITVSLVDSWPSTLTRSNERLTVTPSSRSHSSALRRASVWMKHEQRREVGEIIPAPLACALRRTVPAGQFDIEAEVFIQHVSRSDRPGEVERAVATQLA